jgi:hypothetical protein
MVTVLLLNFRRESNIHLIIKSLKNQTVPCKIFLWNNSESYFKHPDVDLVINSSKNLKCWPRWSMASYAETEYIMSHDDDLVFNSPDTLGTLVNALESDYAPGRAVGFNGVKLGQDLS